MAPVTKTEFNAIFARFKDHMNKEVEARLFAFKGQLARSIEAAKEREAEMAEHRNFIERKGSIVRSWGPTKRALEPEPARAYYDKAAGAWRK